MPARGPRSVLWVVVVTKSECGTGLGMDAGGDETRDVRHVGHHRGADAGGRCADPREINTRE